jgi:hypothetical protein
MTTIVEEWKIIENGGSYEISNYGRVRNKNTNNILKLNALSGYMVVSFTMNNKQMLLKIHRLVATRFLVCTNETHVVNHKDGNKLNNHVDNLEWISASENVKHAYRTGLNKGKKIKVSQYTLDNVFVKEYDSPTIAEIEMGACRSKIIAVCRGKRKTCGGYIWKYSDDRPITEPEPVGKRMSEYPNYIITNEGKVYNSQTQRYLSLKTHVNGYAGVALSRYDNKRTNFNVHRLVALLFIDNPNNCPEVNHIDFNKTNNNVANLEWVTKSENSKHNLTRVNN